MLRRSDYRFGEFHREIADFYDHQRLCLRDVGEIIAIYFQVFYGCQLSFALAAWRDKKGLVAELLPQMNGHHGGCYRKRKAVRAERDAEKRLACGIKQFYTFGIARKEVFFYEVAPKLNGFFGNTPISAPILCACCAIYVYFCDGLRTVIDAVLVVHFEFSWYKKQLAVRTNGRRLVIDEHNAPQIAIKFACKVGRHKAEFFHKFTTEFVENHVSIAAKRPGSGGGCYQWKIKN
jgi:hypothetical protein